MELFRSACGGCSSGLECGSVGNVWTGEELSTHAAEQLWGLWTVEQTEKNYPFVLTSSACTTDFKCHQPARVSLPLLCLTFCLISLLFDILCGTKGKRQTRKVLTSLFHIWLMTFWARTPCDSLTCVLWVIEGYWGEELALFYILSEW